MNYDSIAVVVVGVAEVYPSLNASFAAMLTPFTLFLAVFSIAKVLLATHSTLIWPVALLASCSEVRASMASLKFDRNTIARLKDSIASVNAPLFS